MVTKIKIAIGPDSRSRKVLTVRVTGQQDYICLFRPKLRFESKETNQHYVHVLKRIKPEWWEGFFHTQYGYIRFGYLNLIILKNANVLTDKKNLIEGCVGIFMPYNT